MTIGIYSLSFKGTDRLYIGQSSNIEARFRQHRSKLVKGTHNYKLMWAYLKYGDPILTILLECDIKDLNSLENEAIDIFDSVNNGLNILCSAGSPVLHGENTGAAKYSNQVYMHILQLLVSIPPLTKRRIHELTGVSLRTISHIAHLDSHNWLEEVDPTNYSKLRLQKSNNSFSHRKDYPFIQSPTGEIFKVDNMTAFARDHGLLQPKLSDVLHGHRRSHYGWKLAKVDA